MIKELATMKLELDPDGKGGEEGKPLNPLDKYQGKKRELNILLKDLREEVDRLCQLREKAPDGRDTATIKLYAENARKLKDATAMWNELKEQVIKDQKKGKMDEKELADRKKMVTVFAEEIQQLVNKNSHTKAIKTSETTKQLENKREERTRRRKEEKEKREAKRKARRGDGKGAKSDDEDVINDEDIKPVTQDDVQIQQFMKDVDEQKEEQDKMLDEVLKGMNELKQIATDLNVGIKTGTALVDELDTAMDKTINNFKKSNDRLKEILEESGGMSRWCPVLICIVILLALVGYILNTLKK
jgi:uncharacterized phage infection (PIP) family protein YhgE